MKLHGPIAFVEIYGSNGAMSIRRRVRLTVGDTLRLGAPPPNHVSSPPAPSSSTRKLFAIFGPYGPIYFVARDLNLLDVPASGRKETHASPIYFWWRRFGEPSRNSSRVAALADCWRLRSAVVGGSGASRNWTHLSRIRKRQMKERPVRQKKVTRGAKAFRPEGAESIFR